MLNSAHIRIALAVVAALGVAALLMLILQNVTFNVNVGGGTGTTPSATPGAKPPTPTPQILTCQHSQPTAAAVNYPCRRLAAKQPLPAFTPTPTPTPIPAATATPTPEPGSTATPTPTPYFPYRPPPFISSDFHETDAFSLQENRVLMPHCAAWDDTKGRDPDATPTPTPTGTLTPTPTPHPNVLSPTPTPTPTVGPSPTPVMARSNHAYYFAYAVPESFPNMRDFILDGIDQASAFDLQTSSVAIGEVNGTPTPYRVRVSNRPFYCDDVGGAVVDVEP